MPNDEGNSVTEEQTSAEAGSVDTATVPPEGGEAVRTQGTETGAKAAVAEIDPDKYIPKSQYEALERKLGEQGNELGEMRQFYTDLLPLLEKLEAQPGVAEAILEGKIDAQLAEAVAEGKVSIKEAEEVTEAHANVKKDMSEKDYANASPEDIEKMVEAKLEEKLKDVRSEMKSDVSAVEERREFENKINRFVEATPDFEDYAEGIAGWLKEHPDQYDIETAYYAVKGKSSVEAAQKAAETRRAEESKNMASNAAGGQSQSQGKFNDKEIIDSLIQGNPDPNRWTL